MNDADERPPFEWEARFQADETPWERGDVHPAARMWLETGELAKGMSVIIPGCGRCPEVTAFARAGLEVIAADLSQTAIAWQQRQLAAQKLSAVTIEGDILKPGHGAWYPDQPVDRVYEQTFLCAIPPRLRVAYEASLIKWLKPGGKLLALFMQKEERGGPPYGCSLEAMHELFPDERWIWPPDDHFIAVPHPSLNGKPELAGALTRR